MAKAHARGILIPAEISEPISEFELEDDGQGYLRPLQELVGGMIETVRWDDAPGNATVYMNEEGKLEGLPPNARATYLLRNIGMGVGDYIAGNLVLIGLDPREGETVSLTDDVTVQMIAVACGGRLEAEVGGPTTSRADAWADDAAESIDLPDPACVFLMVTDPTTGESSIRAMGWPDHDSAIMGVLDVIRAIAHARVEQSGGV